MAIVPTTERLVYQDDIEYPPPAWLPQDARPIAAIMLLLISALVWIGHAWFALGYAAGYAVGILKPWIDARGWIVLLFVAIGIPILIIYYRER